MSKFSARTQRMTCLNKLLPPLITICSVREIMLPVNQIFEVSVRLLTLISPIFLSLAQKIEALVKK